MAGSSTSPFSSVHVTVPLPSRSDQYGPLTPANASTPCAPMVSKSTLTLVLSLSVTVKDDVFSKAKLPVAKKKPDTPRVTVPAARVTSASSSKVISTMIGSWVSGSTAPVSTISPSRVCWVRLTSSARLDALKVMPVSTSPRGSIVARLPFTAKVDGVTVPGGAVVSIDLKMTIPSLPPVIFRPTSSSVPRSMPMNASAIVAPTFISVFAI